MDTHLNKQEGRGGERRGKKMRGEGGIEKERKGEKRKLNESQGKERRQLPCQREAEEGLICE